MRDLGNGNRAGFASWLRTGRWAEPLQRKFNPWHNPEDGRFTFSGTGRHYGSPGQGRSPKVGAKRPPLRVDVPGPPPQQTERIRGNDGSFGGAGASASWRRPVVRTEASQGRSHPSGEPGTASADRVPRVSTGIGGQARSGLPFKRIAKTVVRNGYRYEIDGYGRTWRVTGKIIEDPRQRRSKRSQSQAGGKYRLSTDQGGHFIARRFKGPTEAFNHFAQDADFNRNSYFLLEEEWARARRHGQEVTVKIVPVYQGQSRRPTHLNIWYAKGDKKFSVSLPNAREESDGR
ncbi:DNA/RNA non-specific endonuclease [Blastomonas sp.]|uniref:DNA/RNA non-specific endonuclease n=1 Tax=Blastomonas sp. TaxID=1909299 RepID=UPI00391A4DB8